jgi:hypothetical protein
MLTWTEFEKAAPEMASFGRERMGLRVMYIGTVRKDGYPRVHPFTPFVVSGRLFVSTEPTSRKGHDLKRDGRYAMHSQVNDVHGGGDEFALTGRARLVEAQATRSLAVSGCPYKPAERYILFEFQIEECFVNRYVGGKPNYARWKEPSSKS